MMTGWRTKIRRQMNERDTVRSALLSSPFSRPLPLTYLPLSPLFSSLEESSPTVCLLSSSDHLSRRLTDLPFFSRRSLHLAVLMGWETVKFFNSEERENSRYRAAIAEYQGKSSSLEADFSSFSRLISRSCSLTFLPTVLEFKVVGSLNLLNLTQNAIISVGRFTLCFEGLFAATRAEASSFLLPLLSTSSTRDAPLSRND